MGSRRNTSEDRRERKRHKSKARTTPPQSIQKPVSIKANGYFKRTGKRLWASLSALAIIIALFAFFSPKVSIFPAGSTQGPNPFEVLFEVSNDGFMLPLRDVTIELCPKLIQAGASKITGPEDFSGKITFEEGKIGWLRTGERTSVRLPIKILGEGDVQADIALRIHSKTIWLPLYTWRSKIQRFKPSRGPGGNWEWHPYNIR